MPYIPGSEKSSWIVHQERIGSLEGIDQDACAPYVSPVQGSRRAGGADRASQDRRRSWRRVCPIGTRCFIIVRLLTSQGSRADEEVSNAVADGGGVLLRKAQAVIAASEPLFIFRLGRECADATAVA